MGNQQPNPEGRDIVFTVWGIPQTTAAAGAEEWKAAVRAAARAAYSGPMLLGPIKLWVIFFMPRPNSHYVDQNRAGKLKTGAPMAHIGMPDRGSLLRAIEDALTGVLWQCWGQVWDGMVCKMYVPLQPPVSRRPCAHVILRYERSEEMKT